MACKSPAHKAYLYATESLYIQAALAEQELHRALAECKIENPTSPHERAPFKDHLFEEARLRIAHGQRDVAKAVRELDIHFEKGCSNIPKEA